MMTDRFLDSSPLPFCGGCGHALVVRNTARAMAKLDLAPLDVVLVTDIGCHGIIDGHFKTHTVHGLHGRSVALAAGLAVSLPKGKKVVVYIGDGGVVIGLQHLIEAAHRNFDMTVIVFNNMLYGMTGGQPSGVTPSGYRTPTCPNGVRERGYDICRRVHTAGAASAQRVIGRGDFSEAIAKALAIPGFALVEVLEQCVSYGMKYNPDRSLADIAGDAGLAFESLQNPGARPLVFEPRSDCPSLLDIKPVVTRYSARLDHRISVLLGGSAGEGIQVAADLFARAAIASGLSATRKGSYPVTVGVGYSAAEIILSPEPITHAGYISPDAAVITSVDGLNHFRSPIAGMRSGSVLVDESVPRPETGAALNTVDIRGFAGARGSAIYALLLFLQQHRYFPVEALRDEVADSKLAGKIDIDRLYAAAAGRSA